MSNAWIRNEARVIKARDCGEGVGLIKLKSVSELCKNIPG
jgi:hypothetical protein